MRLLVLLAIGCGLLHAADYVVPGVSNEGGQKTRLTIVNRAGAPATAKFRLAGESLEAVERAIPALGTLVLTDILSELWSLSERRGALLEQLKLHEEFEPVAAESAGQGLQRIKDERFDVVLLDVNLPDMDGRELCRLMRRQGVKAPIIMLTAADTDSDTILGLEAGANDYITKPFKLNVLLARLRAHLR